MRCWYIPFYIQFKLVRDTTNASHVLLICKIQNQATSTLVKKEKSQVVWLAPDPNLYLLLYVRILCRSITRAYYRNSVGGLLLFDITNRRSFQNVHDWLEEARSHVQPHSIVFLLVGHKCDLEAQRQVCTVWEPFKGLCWGWWRFLNVT